PADQIEQADAEHDAGNAVENGSDRGELRLVDLQMRAQGSWMTLCPGDCPGGLAFGHDVSRPMPHVPGADARRAAGWFALGSIRAPWVIGLHRGVWSGSGPSEDDRLETIGGGAHGLPHCSRERDLDTE